MVAYNFQPQFEGDLVAGRKTSTIRPKGKRRHAQPGELVQIYVGQRTPNCRKLVEAPCLAAKPIEIHENAVFVAGRHMAVPEYYDRLAEIEGFSSFGNLQAWFDRQNGLPARGLVQITWDFAAKVDFSNIAGEAREVAVEGGR